MAREDVFESILCHCMYCGREEILEIPRSSLTYKKQKYYDKKRKIYYCMDSCDKCHPTFYSLTQEDYALLSK